jgi:hypothetical protein
MRRLLVLAALVACALATASPASARVVQRAHTDKRFGYVTAGGRIGPQERFVSVKAVSVPYRTMRVTLSFACIRRDNTVAIRQNNVERRMAPFTLTLRRPRTGDRCFASATARLAQQLLPQNFTSSIYIKLSARRR